MGYTPNNPYIPGDPYSYDLKWMVENLNKIKDNIIQLEKMYTTPTVVDTAAEMTDINKIYVYTGSEVGYQTNHWYYYDPDTNLWTDGGIYGSISPDTALSLSSTNAVENRVITNALAGKEDTLPVPLTIDRGGTGIGTPPSFLTDLSSTTAASPFAANPRPGVTGTLPITQGGTGLTAAPSMLANLSSITPASPFQANPEIGIKGTLPISHGGTGRTTSPFVTYVGTLSTSLAAQAFATGYSSNDYYLISYYIGSNEYKASPYVTECVLDGTGTISFTRTNAGAYGGAQITFVLEAKF